MITETATLQEATAELGAEQTVLRLPHPHPFTRVLCPSCILGSWPFQLPYRMHVQVSLSCCFRLGLGQWEAFRKILRGERCFFSMSCVVLWAGCGGILSGCHSLRAVLFRVSSFNGASVEMPLLFLTVSAGITVFSPLLVSPFITSPSYLVLHSICMLVNSSFIKISSAEPPGINSVSFWDPD